MILIIDVRKKGKGMLQTVLEDEMADLMEDITIGTVRKTEMDHGLRQSL